MEKAKKKDVFGGFLIALAILILVTMIVSFIVKAFLWSVIFLGLPLIISCLFFVFFLMWVYVD